jgi:hypothetical protein
VLRALGRTAAAPPAEKRVRRLVPVLGVVVLALATAAVGMAATPTVTATADPANPLFGDAFTYVVVVKTPSGDAGRTRIVDDVGPFARVGPTRTTHSVSNGVTTTTVTETLACLSTGCMSTSPDGRPVALPRARAVLDGAAAEALPVTVRIGTRVPASEVTASEPPFRRPHEIPAVSYPISPGMLEAALAVAGGLLPAAAALGLAVPIVRRRRQAAREPAAGDPVARAVRLLRESTVRDATDRRRAAGLASRVVDRPDLSLEAATVAWSRPAPGPPDAASLADRVEQAEAPA